ncbi:MAG: ATPase [Finegoldia sp.]|nr:ATPase [Finegoldia sp.]
MLDINSKISIFRKMIWDSEKEKSQSQLEEAIERNKKNLEDKEKSLEDSFNDHIRKRQAFADYRKNELIAKENELAKDKYYKHKKELLDRLKADMIDELKRYTDSPNYKAKLEAYVQREYEKLKAEDPNVDYYLLVRQKDEDLFEGKGYEVKSLPDKYIGGFLLKSQDDSFQYDFTLIRKLSDYNYEIGKRLYSLLESEED